MEKITLRNLNLICKAFRDWNPEKVEERFHGTRKQLIKELNGCNEQEVELFFSGFFCENPIVEMLSDGQIDIKSLSSSEKVQVFIQRGLILCDLTNHEPGLVVKAHWNK